MQYHKNKTIQYKESKNIQKSESQENPIWEAKSIVQISVSLRLEWSMEDLGVSFVMASHQ